MNLDAVSPKLIGEKVVLGPIREELNDHYRRWLHDPEVSFYLVASRLLTSHMETEWIRDAVAAGHVLFTIYDKNSGAPIGTTSLMGTDHVNRTAEFGIMIGEKEYQNRGFGSEATLLTVDYGFNILNLESIYLRVHDFNRRALRIYEKVGFKTCGRRRRAYYIGNQYHDDIYMDIVRDEFRQSMINPMVNQLLQNAE